MNTSTDQPSSPTKLKVLVFAASLRAESLNRKLAALAARVAEQNGATVDLASMRDFDVPSMTATSRRRGGSRQGRRSSAAPCGVRRLHHLVPEYNASMPGVLKNLIDWTSRFRPQPFDGRHGLLLSASPSLAGGNRGLWALRVPLEHLGARIFPGHVLACRWPTRRSPATIADPRCERASRRTCRRFSRSPRRRSTTRASRGRGSSSSASRQGPVRIASTPSYSRAVVLRWRQLCVAVDSDWHFTQAIEETRLSADRPPVVQEHLDRPPHGTQPPMRNPSRITSASRLS